MNEWFQGLFQEAIEPMLHNILKRQLETSNASEQTAPQNSAWQDFLDAINRTYIDADQEKYLLQRSLQIAVNERASLLAQLQQSEARYALAAQGAGDGLWDWDIQNNEFYYSNRWLDILGITNLQSCPSMRNFWLDRIHPEDFDQVLQQLEHYLAGESEHFSSLHRIRHEDGNYRWVLMRGACLRDSLGQAIRVAGSLHDNTEQINFSNEVQRSKSLFVQAVDNVPCFIVMKDHTGKIVLANKVLADMFGVSVKNIKGKSLEEFNVPKAMLENIRIFDQRILTGTKDVLTSEFTVTELQDTPQTFEVTRRRFYPAGSAHPHVLCIGFDITERKQLFAQVNHSQKLESIGQLAAGIAHEINTPTQFVSDNTKFIRDAFQDMKAALLAYDELLRAAQSGTLTPELIASTEQVIEDADVNYLLEEVPTSLEQTFDGLSRITKIVRSMRDFAHTGRDHMQSANINHALESTLTVSRNEWKYIAEVETDYDPDLPVVNCYIGELNQVFLNLIINAAHAIEDVVGTDGNMQGKITVSTRTLDEQWIEIRITDTGKGIPPEVQNKIFDPFFTTKEVGKGTGQGLTISHSVIVEKHKGTIRFETVLNQGTTFIICLPR